MNYYEILRVPTTATLLEIKKAYKNLVKRYHPDIYEGSKVFAEYKIKEINEAYEILKTQETKAEYDAELNYKKYNRNESDFITNKTKVDYEKYRNAYNTNVKSQVKKEIKQEIKKTTLKSSINSVITSYFAKIENRFRPEEKQDFIIFLLTSLIIFLVIEIVKILY